MTSEGLVTYIDKNPFLLAPMAAITDHPFRSFMRQLGCSAVISELVSATGLKFNNAKTQKLMSFAESQHPVGIQLFGDNLEHLHDAAKVVEQMGADFVDLNFGCPVPKVVKKGAGSACLRDLNVLRQVLRAVKSAVTIPVTIKIRTGWDDATKNSPEVAQVAYDEGITWVAIHGRTRAQAYNGLADWDYIARVKAVAKLPIIGNGDIHTAEQAVHRLQTTGCDGVMIGRGCLKNPFIFRQCLQLWGGESVFPVSQGLRNYMALFHDLQAELEAFYDERLMLLQLKKLASWYSSGFPGSSQFRKTVFQFKERVEVLDAIYGYFETLADVPLADTSHEAFLMGGHG